MNLRGPGEALIPLDPHGGNYCGVSLITRVLHLGSRLWPATKTPAGGGVRVRPALANAGRAKRPFSTGFIRFSASGDPHVSSSGNTNGFDDFMIAVAEMTSK